MQGPRAVDTDADKEIIFTQELAPFIVKQRTIGLHGVLKGHVRPLVLILVCEGAPEEFDPHQGGFSTLPGDRHLVGAMGFDELA